jgi:ribosome-associated protein
MFPTEKRQNHADDIAEAPSKSERKRAMHELQALGEALIELDPGRLAALDLPERLADAIAQARGITQHEGRRRQLQFVGKLMRDVDAAPIKAALMEWQRGSNAARARFARLEHWRERVLVEPEGLAHFLAAYPNADHATLTALVNDARAERAREGPPHKSRALFRALTRIVDDTNDAAADATSDSSGSRS